jgi:hypothetical protein
MLKSVHRFLRSSRRKRKQAARPVYDYRANTNRKNMKATARHIAEVKQDQAYGIILGDGVTLASIANRWVRQSLHRQGRLYRRDKPKAA